MRTVRSGAGRGRNDEIMKDPAFASGGTRSVARADVARVCKAALGSASATGVALDLVSKKAGGGTPLLLLLRLDGLRIIPGEIHLTSHVRRRTRRTLGLATFSGTL